MFMFHFEATSRVLIMAVQTCLLIMYGSCSFSPYSCKCFSTLYVIQIVWKCARYEVVLYCGFDLCFLLVMLNMLIGHLSIFSREKSFQFFATSKILCVRSRDKAPNHWFTAYILAKIERPKPESGSNLDLPHWRQEIYNLSHCSCLWVLHL